MDIYLMNRDEEVKMLNLSLAASHRAVKIIKARTDIEVVENYRVMCVARVLVSEIMTTEIGRFRDLIIAGHMSRETLRKHQSAMIKAFFNVYASAFTVFDTTNKSPQMIVRQMSDIYEVLKNFNDMLDTRVWYETEEADRLNEKRKLHSDIAGNDQLLGEVDKIISLVLKNKQFLEISNPDLYRKIIWTSREIRKNKAKYLEFTSPEETKLEI